MYRTALAWAYPSRSRSSANASMCGPLIPARNRWSVLGAEKYFSSMGFSLLSIGHGRPHQRSRSPELMVSRRPPIRSKRLPSPPILAPDSPEANTPHNARVIRDVGAIAASGTTVDVTAEYRRTAVLDRVKNAQMLIGQPGTVVLDESFPVLSN